MIISPFTIISNLIWICVANAHALRAYDAIAGPIIENNFKFWYRDSGPIVQDHVCENTSCYFIYDLLGHMGYEPCFVRVFGVDLSFNIGYSIAVLKTPQEMTENFFDTKTWMPNKGRIQYDPYPPAICEAFFWSGAIPKESTDKIYNILIIGLGGGDFNNYYDVTYPHLNITVVEMSKAVVEIARKWFNVTESSRHHIIQQEGISFIKSAISAGIQYDGVLLDATYSSMSQKYVSPVAEFLEPSAVEALSKIITNEGALVSNVVIGDNVKDTVKARLELVELYQKQFHFVELLEVSDFNSVLIARNIPFYRDTDTLLAQSPIPFRYWN